MYILVFEQEGYQTIITDEADVFAANKTTMDAQVAAVEGMKRLFHTSHKA
ncbi:hypothetical protein KEM09_19400 [Carboxylicivirga mesophila]|uniref:Isochorismatase-like domain-containing protein n=1 Tax=Carboxylicivirga mesophila TaxID=1166478 RepID=A0ABS5KEV4_9BACT|nr:hypothetical protein [Carboxylicivirga mesophila]MBS2213583.1 hypothetical protein [Carboxylicivirga mesophila]